MANNNKQQQIVARKGARTDNVTETRRSEPECQKNHAELDWL